MARRSSAATDSGFRWLIACLLFALVLVATVGYAGLAYALEPSLFEADLESAGGASLLLGAVGLGLVLALVPAGLAADLMGGRRILLAAAVFAASGLVASAMFANFTALFAGRILLGLGAGAILPTISRIVADWFSPHERAFALAGILVAVPLGLALSVPLMALVGALVGWRAPLWCLAALVVVWCGAWSYLFTDDPARSAHVSPRELQRIGCQPREGRGTARRWPAAAHARFRWSRSTAATVLANSLALAVAGYGLFYVIIWTVDVLLARGAGNGALPAIAVISPWLAASLLLWLGGLWSDFRLRETGWLRKSRTGVIIWSALGTLFLLMLLAPVVLARGVPIVGVVTAVSASVGLITAALPALLATIIDMARRWAGTLSGLSLGCFAAAAFLAPAVSHKLASATGDLTIPFLLMLGLQALSIAVLLACHRPDRSL